MTTKNYDIIVIGSGQGGKPLATAAATSGRNTALIEKKYVGGSCINYGCTPTKTMVASARIAYLAQRAGEYGVEIPAVSVNMSKVRERKRSIVESWRNAGRKGLENTENLDLLFGTARFTDARTIEVEQEGGNRLRLSAETIVINTGAKPVVAQITGLGEVGFLDSTAIMELDEVPQHLLILGGGYIGLEFGQMFRRFGSQVSIIQRGQQLLAREDPDVAEAVRQILQEEGIKIYLQSEAVKAEQLSEKQIVLTLKTADGEQRLSGSHLLIAAGRAPNSAELNLEAAGVHSDQRGYIMVNERLETNVPGIFAIGDVKPGPAFTHISYDDYRVLKTNLLENGKASIRSRLVPYTVFIDPQLGRVGLNETEARRQGRNIRVAKLPMNHVARALEANESRGFMKAIADADTGQILGCAVLGMEGGEMMSMLQIAMMGGVTYPRLREAVFAHPTLAESLNNLFNSFQNES